MVGAFDVKDYFVNNTGLHWFIISRSLNVSKVRKLLTWGRLGFSGVSLRGAVAASAARN